MHLLYVRTADHESVPSKLSFRASSTHELHQDRQAPLDVHVQSGRVLCHALPLTCGQALGQLAVVDPLLPADFPGSLAADDSVEQQQEGGGS